METHLPNNSVAKKQTKNKQTKKNPHVTLPQQRMWLDNWTNQRTNHISQHLRS